MKQTISTRSANNGIFIEAAAERTLLVNKPIINLIEESSYSLYFTGDCKGLGFSFTKETLRCFSYA